jgi:hypothetical protein
LYGIELLVDVDLKGGEICNCGGYSHVPLPSQRSLWEPVSSAEWAARFKASRVTAHSDKALTMLDLRKARRALGVEPGDEGEEGRLVARVSQWCANLDEFGMMIWMAIMMG